MHQDAKVDAYCRMALLFTPLSERVPFKGVAGRITKEKRNNKGVDQQAQGGAVQFLVLQKKITKVHYA